MSDSWTSTFGSYASSAASTAKSVWNSEAVASGTAAIGSYAGSAANTAKQAWNSEAVANGSSKIGSYAGSAASTVSTTAQNVWNSEAVASGTASVRNGVNSTAKHVQTWWNTPKETSEENEKSVQDGCRGTVLAMSKNASNYVVKTVGRTSNIVNIYDKTKISSLGNPKWWIRYDRPHGNVPYSHINMNPKLTGVPDPHIPISGATAKAAGYMGKVAEVANDVAPYVATAVIAYEGYKVAQEIQKDYEHGTTRNTIERVSKVGGAYTAGSMGAATGGWLGSLLMPGIGTIFGGLIGGGVSGYYGGQASHAIAEKTLDHYKWDTVDAICNSCTANFQYKLYKEAGNQYKQPLCGGCHQKCKL